MSEILNVNGAKLEAWIKRLEENNFDNDLYEFLCIIDDALGVRGVWRLELEYDDETVYPPSTRFFEGDDELYPGEFRFR